VPKATRRADLRRFPRTAFDQTGHGTEGDDVNHYLLSIYQPDGAPPSREVLEPIMRAVAEFNRELAAAGARVFSGGLEPPRSAVVIRPEGTQTFATDGPFIESKEILGGLCIVSAPDLETALAWGHKAARATTLPIEVRPFQQ
jgi:hypothetical protein